MKFHCAVFPKEGSIELEKSNCVSGIFLRGFDTKPARKGQVSTHMKKADARAFALEILRICGDEQPAETPQAEPVPTKAIVVQRLTNGKLRPSYTPFVHDSVPAAIAEARRLAECNHTGSFVVFTPVAEAKATVSVDLTHTPTI